MFRKKRASITENLESKTLYEILGVEFDAPIERIYPEFYKLIKKHHPSKDPEGFMILDQAYVYLSNDEFRKRYNSLITCGDDTKSLVNQAQSAILNGHFAGADVILKKIVKDTNESPDALMFLVSNQIRQCKYKTAVDTLQKLVDLYPNNQHYRNYMAVTLKDLNKVIEDKKFHREYFELAEKQLRASIEIDESDMYPYQLLVSLYFWEDMLDPALDWAEKGINVPKLDEMKNFKLLLMSLMIKMEREDDEDLIREQLLQLEDVIPENIYESKADAVNDILDFCRLLLNNEKFDTLKLFALTALRIFPDDPYLQRVVNDFDYIITIVTSRNKLKSDSSIISTIRDYVDFSVDVFLQNANLDEHDKKIDELMIRLESSGITDVHKSIRILRERYYPLWELQSKFWNYIESVQFIISDTGNSEKDSTLSFKWIFMCISIISIIIKIVIEINKN